MEGSPEPAESAREFFGEEGEAGLSDVGPAFRTTRRN